MYCDALAYGITHPTDLGVENLCKEKLLLRIDKIMDVILVILRISY